MLCKRPFMQGIQPRKCGQCNPCRINRRREWTHRLMLESKSHADSSFLTLTYAQEKLPAGGTLVPKHPQDFLKRLRSSLPYKIRYYLVGEYGDQTARPHYHLALFGYPTCTYSRSRYRLYKNCCTNCDRIRDHWTHGHVDLGTLTTESAQYIAGYVTKKLTNKNDPQTQKVLNGRHPEFARMSLKPGIGALSVDSISLPLTTDAGTNLIIQSGDVPSQFQHGSKKLPLGRYLKTKIRTHLGFPEPHKTPLGPYQEKMFIMYEEAITKNPNLKGASAIVEENKQIVRNIETNAKIFSKKGSL